MIDIVGKNITQATLLDGVKKAGMLSISLNEVTNSNDEILSIFMRYLNKSQNIHEVFLGFLNLDRITGKHIAVKIF